MAPDDEDRDGTYAGARRASGVLLVVLVFAIVLFDAIRIDFEASPLIVTALLVAAGAMFSVDVKLYRR